MKSTIGTSTSPQSAQYRIGLIWGVNTIVNGMSVDEITVLSIVGTTKDEDWRRLTAVDASRSSTNFLFSSFFQLALFLIFNTSVPK